MDKARTLEFIKERQRQWAATREILVAPNGRVKNLDENFFAPLHMLTRQEIVEGDGNELGYSEHDGKIYSLWSSSALACNVFDYWRERPLGPLLNALSSSEANLDQPKFEQKFATGIGSARANLDVFFAARPLAIESKFTEPYCPGQKDCLSGSYFMQPKTWVSLESCRSVADTLHQRRFECFDAAQILKHIIGLTKAYGHRNFVLLYLWYEVEGSDASKQHKAEIADFDRSVTSDEVLFRAESYQVFFNRLLPSIVDTQYEAYLRSRYFGGTAGINGVRIAPAAPTHGH